MSIRVEGLTKIYRKQKAIDDLTFEAPSGVITGFLGPNGAGKSTTMKIATGYTRPTSGDVLINDRSVNKDPYTIKQITGYLPEHNPLYLEMYVREFLTFIANAFKLPGSIKKDRVNAVIDRCGLQVEAHKKIRMLSKGYRQRVGLAKAMLPEPEVLILDEPTTGLDPNQIIEIRNLIREVGENKTVILSTHIMQEVEAICDRVIILDKGKLIVDQEVRQLLSGKESKTSRFKVEFEEPIDEAVLSSWEVTKKCERQSDRSFILEIDKENARNLILQYASENNLPLLSVKKEGQSLEEIFHQLTEKQVK